MTYRPFAPLLATALFLLAGAVFAERPPAPLTDTSSLPVLGDAWRDTNPYRDDETIAAVGRTLYNETCSKCHGPDMNAKGHPAPPLRRPPLRRLPRSPRPSRPPRPPRRRSSWKASW